MFIHIAFCVFMVICQQNNNVFAQRSNSTGSNSIVYITAVFRHGERTVDVGTLYPNDPYINETYYPYGLGQLTAKGKEREFTLGQTLRKRYDFLLGHVFTPDILEPISTNMNRTKASLALVLAGLYPPVGNVMEWNSKLNWQPIPYNYVEYEEDMWFTISTYFCSNFAKEYALYLTSPKGKQMQDKYQSLLQYLRINTGLNISRTMEIFSIFSCLQSQSEWGLKLPEWTKSVWPGTLMEATKDGLSSGVSTPKLKQLAGGLLLQRILQNMKAKSNNTLEPDIRKMSLYSGHDVSIIYLLGALNVFVPHIVPYGACILIELHNISNSFYVKVLYEDYTAAQPRTLTIPGCEQLCPLSKFESLLKPNLPEGDNPCGDDLKVFEAYAQRRDYYCGRLRPKSVIKDYTKQLREKPKSVDNNFWTWS